MTVTQTPRFGFDTWDAGTDAWPGRTGWNTALGKIEQAAGILLAGVLSSRPAAGVARRFYWATDNSRLYLDDGATWTEVSPTTGGGIPAQNTIGGAGAEGNSRIAARSDHRHPHLGEWIQSSNTTGAGWPNATWYPFAGPGTWLAGNTTSHGTNLTFDTNGMIAAAPGMYRIHGQMLWAGNATGRRGIGIHTNTAGPPTVENQTVVNPGVGNNGFSQHINTEIVTVVPTTFVMFAFQDSGAGLAISSARITVEYRG